MKHLWFGCPIVGITPLERATYFANKLPGCRPQAEQVVLGEPEAPVLDSAPSLV